MTTDAECFCPYVQEFSASAKEVITVRVSLRSVPLPELSGETAMTLSPFLTGVSRVLVPQARKAGFRRTSPRILGRILEEIRIVVADEIGHSVEITILLFAMKRSVQFLAQAVRSDATIGMQRAQLLLIDCVWKLLSELERFCSVDLLMCLAVVF